MPLLIFLLTHTQVNNTNHSESLLETGRTGILQPSEQKHGLKPVKH